MKTLCFLKFYIVVFAFLLPVLGCAQVAIGSKIYTRLTDDRVGPTQGVGLMISFLDPDSTGATAFFGAFDASFPQYFDGTATARALDSATVPYTITVPASQTVTDYMLHAGGGFVINPKRKPNCFVITFGLRGLYRRVKVNYLTPVDENIYGRYGLITNPDIPAALNLGFSIGAGYWYRHKWLVLYPHATFGFGSNDWRNNHPWNSYPNYIEFSLAAMFSGK